MNQPLVALISARAKKFIANHLLQTFTSKKHKNSQGFKRWPSVTKPIIVGKKSVNSLK